MSGPGRDHAPPAEMTVAELEAAAAALPGKRDALREAFDRLAACSPAPLPFAWVDLDAHMSSLHSSISLRVRQVRALEAARAAPAPAAPGETRGDGTGENPEEVEVEEVVEDDKEVMEVEEEVVEEEEEVMEVEEEVVEEEEEVMEVEEEVVEEGEEEKDDQEMQEEGGGSDEAEDKIGKGGKDGKESRYDVLQEEEVEEVADDKNDNADVKDDKLPEGEELDADKETQVANEEEQGTEDAEKASQYEEEDANMEEERSAEDAKKASRVRVEDGNLEEEQDTDMEEAATKKASAVQEEEVCGEEQDKEKIEQEAHQEEEGAKNVTKKVTAVAKEVSNDQGNRALPGAFNYRTAAFASTDARRLVKLICTKTNANTGLNSEFHAAKHRAPDAAALALHVVELFLHNKMLKTNKTWVNCVALIRMVPVVVTKPSANTIDQAKQVAKDWKEMIDNPGSCMVLGSLASWGLLYFLISYNIVSEYETKEIFRLFGAIPRKQMKMNYATLVKGLGLTDRIPELMDYLIGNGQQMDAIFFARVFNLVDKYPPVSLLKGYVEKAKETAVEISQKNITGQSLSAVIIKELENLRRAHDIAKQQITDSSLSTSIGEEINALLEEFGKRKRSIAHCSTASVSNSQQQHLESNKKQKKEQDQERHEGQESQQQGQQSKPGEKLQKKLDKPQHKQQQQQEKPQEPAQQPQPREKKQEDRPQEKQQHKPQHKQQQPREKKQEDKPQEKQQQTKQQHGKRSRQHTSKLPARASPVAQNAPLRGHFGHPPYAAIHGIHPGHPTLIGWPGVHCVQPFAPQPGAPEYIGPFNPFYPNPEFYP